MNRRRSLRRAAVLVALVGVTCPLAACGGGGSAASWVSEFCGSGSSFRTVLSGTNQAIKASLQITGLAPADLKQHIVTDAATIVDASAKAGARVKDAGEPSVKQGTEIEAAAVAAYAGFDERAKALQTEAGALSATSAGALADGIGPYSQHVADLSRDVAGSFAALRQYQGYPALEKASTTPDDYGTVDTCRDLQTVAK